MKKPSKVIDTGGVYVQRNCTCASAAIESFTAMRMEKTNEASHNMAGKSATRHDLP